MSIIVQKYGGSSLSTNKKIKKIAEKIAAKKRKNYNVVVVVSAMGKTTNKLIESAGKISDNPDKREMDMLLSAGERITMALLCIQLKDMGFDAISLTGSQAGIITNDSHNDARVIEIRPFRVQDELRHGRIVVVGGFQGVSYKRDITTLGRGGSDTSAVALAAALDADYCEIYSDVDGVYSADPNVVKNAIHLPEISFQQMQEMSMAGAKVLNAQAVEFAKNASITLYAKSSFSDVRETVIKNKLSSDSTFIKSVVYEKDILKVMIDNIELNGEFITILKYFDKNQIPIKELNILETKNDNKVRITFLISNKNIYNWKKVKTELENICNNISFESKLSAISIIGESINHNNKILSETLEILDRNNIHIYGITTTSFRLSLLVESVVMEKALNLIHSNWIKS